MTNPYLPTPTSPVPIGQGQQTCAVEQPRWPFYIAGIAPRFAAAVIDVCVYGSITFSLLVSAASVDPNNEDPALTLAALLAGGLIACFYVSSGLHRRGATLGMRLMSLRVVDRRTGALPTVGQAVGRFVLTWVLSTPALLGCLIAGGEREHRSWYDHATGTVVIRV